MNIDLTKFVKNKDLKLSNDDIDLEGLESEIRKGYTKDSDVKAQIKEATKDMVAKSDFDKVNSDLSAMTNNYNNTVKTLNDTNEKMAEISFNSKLAENHFNKKDYQEVREIRNSIFKDVKDDNEAISKIAEKFKGTYFPNSDKTGDGFTKAPNESSLKNNNVEKGNEIHITRKTRVKDLLISK